MTIIDEIAETLRREMLFTRRHAIRSGAQMYARPGHTRFDALWALGITPSDNTLADLKKRLGAMMEAKQLRSWRYDQNRHIAILQCLGGELILAGRFIKSTDQILQAAE